MERAFDGRGLIDKQNGPKVEPEPTHATQDNTMEGYRRITKREFYERGLIADSLVTLIPKQPKQNE